MNQHTKNTIYKRWCFLNKCEHLWCISTSLYVFYWYSYNNWYANEANLHMMIFLHTYTSNHPITSQCQCQTKFMKSILISSTLDWKCLVFLHFRAHCDKTKPVITFLLLKVMQIFINENIADSVNNMKIKSLYNLRLLHAQQNATHHKSSKMVKNRGV